MKTIITSIGYFFIAALFILLRNQPGFLLPFILKALLMPALVVLFIMNLRPAGNRSHYLMLAGLCFSWAGDLFLEVPGEYGDLFLPGLTSFLLAQIMYMTVFFTTPGRNILARRFCFLLPVVLYGAGLVYYLYNGMGIMKIPVTIYAIMILTMLSAAINRYDKVNRTTYWLVLAGAILFVLSDSGIAVNRFGHPFTGAQVFIMSTYVVAQYLIVTGYIRQYKVESL